MFIHDGTFASIRGFTFFHVLCFTSIMLYLMLHYLMYCVCHVTVCHFLCSVKAFACLLTYLLTYLLIHNRRFLLLQTKHEIGRRLTLNGVFDPSFKKHVKFFFNFVLIMQMFDDYVG